MDEPKGADAELQIVVKYANTMHVKLYAKGTGTTVVFPEWLSKIGILIIRIIIIGLMEEYIWERSRPILYVRK